MAVAELFAPPSFWDLPEAFRSTVMTACGAGKGIGNWVIPDKIFGLRITEACKIHDYMYAQGATIEEKEQADRVFLNNMLRLIEADYHKSRIPIWRGILASLRRHAAITYYNAVHDFGGPAFWKGKNEPGTLDFVQA
jgi:hypothetical protein